jgi:DNA-binding response OmpR family regulator
MGYRHLIIGVTGNALDVDVRDFEESGADVVLLKPLRLDLLTKILEYCRRNIEAISANLSVRMNSAATTTEFDPVSRTQTQSQFQGMITIPFKEYLFQ